MQMDPKSNDNFLYKRHNRETKGDVRTEAEAGVYGHKPKKSATTRSVKRHVADSLQSLCKEGSSVRTLILDVDLQNYERINFHSLKSLGLG